MKQEIILGSQAREKLFKGVEKIAKPVIASLGVNGRNTIFMKNDTILSTKDGVTIANEIKELKDPVENFGARLIKQASIKTGKKVGDGTTTSTLLAYEMIKNSFENIRPKTNLVNLKREMETAVEDVISYLKSDISEDIKEENQLKQIASISANNDKEIGALVSKALDEAGIDGIIHLEESRSGETYLENVEGTQFNRGYLSPYFVTNNSNMTSVLEDPYILIFEGALTQAKDLVKILEQISTQGKSLLIIAEKVEGEALAMLVVNKMRGTLKVCAVSSPEFGERRKLVLEDIATLTGAKLISKDKGMNLANLSWDWLGNSKLVTIEKDTTTIVGGKGDEVEIEERVKDLQTQITKASSPYEIEKLNDRLAKFSGGVHIIHVGGFDDTDMSEKKDRIDDSIHAAKAAYEEGIVPGGGIALLRARQNIKNKDTVGGKIVYDACLAPFRQILSNAGMDNDRITEIKTTISVDDRNIWAGYNLKIEKFVDMKEAGIIDPTKVTRNAIQNAVSVAGIILLTEGIIIDTEDDKADEGVDPSMFM